jgi:hypothetical protein
MDASAAAVAELKPIAPSAKQVALGLRCAIVAVGLLTVVAAVVCQRRLAGALEEPLPVFTLAATVIMAAAIALFARVVSHRFAIRAPAGVAWAVRVLPSAALLALAVALAIPGTALAGAWLLAGIVVAEEMTAWWLNRRLMLEMASDVAADEPAKEEPPSFAPAWQPVPVETADIADDQLSQQWTRRRAADGSEIIHGLARATFDTGVRTATVHVAFCPPLEGEPQITFEHPKEFDVRVKTGQLLPYGARFDLKLTRAAEQPVSFLLRFEAVSKPELQNEARDSVTETENRRVDGPHRRWQGE